MIPPNPPTPDEIAEWQRELDSLSGDSDIYRWMARMRRLLAAYVAQRDALDPHESRAREIDECQGQPFHEIHDNYHRVLCVVRCRCPEIIVALRAVESEVLERAAVIAENSGSVLDGMMMVGVFVPSRIAASIRALKPETGEGR